MGVVRGVEPGQNADRAGVLVGDRVVAWEGSEATSLERLLGVEFEFSHARVTRLRIRRGDRDLELALDPGDWGWRLEPDWTPAGAAEWARIAVVSSSKDEDSWVRRVLQLAGEIEQAGAPEIAQWVRWSSAEPASAAHRVKAAQLLFDSLLSESEASKSGQWELRAILGLARLAVSTGEHEAARQRFEEAARLAQSRGGGLNLAHVLLEWQDFEASAKDPRREPELAEQAVEICREAAPASLDLASALNHRGVAAFYQGRIEEARRDFSEALALRQRLQPESLDIARTLNNLASASLQLGDLAAAREFLQDALAAVGTPPRDPSIAADTWNNFGNVELSAGDLDHAREHYLRALSLRRGLAPESVEVAEILNNLSLVARERGELDDARANHLQSLAILERAAPRSPALASVLENLGVEAYETGNLEAARSYADRAFALRSEQAPGSLDVASAVTLQGAVLAAEGDSLRAREAVHKALQIRRALAPSSLAVAESLSALAELTRVDGTLAEATTLETEALEIRQRMAPGSVLEAISEQSLATLAFEGGELDRAETLLSRSLKTLSTLARGTQLEARTLGMLGRVAAARQDWSRARELLEQAIRAIEKQRSRVGEEGSRTWFAEKTESFYHDLIGVEVTQGAFEEALLTLERSRAQGLLEMLAERDLLRAAQTRLPIPLQARLTRLKERRRALAQSYAERGPVQAPSSQDAWLARSTALDAEEEVLSREIRGAAPGFAELVYPEPASFAEIEQTLEPGTLLLAYSVGDSASYLLAGLRETDGKFSTRGIRIECDAEQLGVRIAAWSMLLAHPRVTTRGASWRPPARAFYRELIAPVAQELARAKRVILVSDGPLHLLPFAALVADATDSQPLGVRFPLTMVPSMTVLRELRRRQSSQTPDLAWAGLGDPLLGRLRPAGSPPGEARAMTAPPALPGARAELIAVSAMFAGPTRLLLGAAATERAAKTLPASTRIVHFACHARTNGRFPMQSELLLAPEPPPDAPAAGLEDGVLQAWEVLDDVRLETELVVLSACDTGIGKLSGGEGVVGLSRAFLFAGARSLLASLWPVADRSGARLVVGFYENLLHGLPKDEALRRSRARILEESPEAHPYVWAGLELFGDPAPVPGIAGQGNWRAALGAALLSIGIGLLGLAWRLFKLRRTFSP